MSAQVIPFKQRKPARLSSNSAALRKATPATPNTITVDAEVYRAIGHALRVMLPQLEVKR